MAERRSHAVVLGSGFAGLLASRVLSEFYESVTVVERDVLPDRPEHRKGVPQGRHLHNFLSRGTQLLGELFPGILTELATAGATVDEGDDLSRLYVRSFGYELTPSGKLADPQPLAAYQASRPFVEFHVRRRLTGLANVTILDNHTMVEPLMAANTIVGARIVNNANGIAGDHGADLVVDATGRASRAHLFLEGRGYGPVPQDRLPANWGYSSHLLRVAPGRIRERLAFVNQSGSAPGAVLMAYEHGTWMLAISRSAVSGPPPRTLAEMLTIADDLLPPAISTALHTAEPLGQIAMSRATAARWRRYDQVPRLPTGLLVLGDALCTLNPLYGQGMTMAGLQALALRDCLTGSAAGLMDRFYRAAADQMAPVWAANKASERLAPVNPTIRRRARNALQRAALAAATVDIGVAERLLRVRGLIDPPERLQDPALFAQILTTHLRHPGLVRQWTKA
ncbi:hypothetical protein MANY_39820 [Mycolicibacterium anyangense]|uniref:Hydroxylase n=1 Tax=Mycolicibacterium anyangense TaxID=1431246 RepID=A0A6N4WCZ8_9MYCO|nr:FAD-dependent oxidoreductase [Mycolicibacterium anyangense]BBZ78645.1 hypothetical protein MANY_39820 [Mycolicibacterium anyangense]